MHPTATGNARLRIAPPEEAGRAAGVAWRWAAGIVSPRRAASAMASCRGRVLLITAGAAIGRTDRALDAWAEAITARAARLILYGPGANELAERLAATRGTAIVVRCSDVVDAAQAAAHLARRGGTVLLAVPTSARAHSDDAVVRYRAAVGALAAAELPMEVA